jgi:hypothetical protein
VKSPLNLRGGKLQGNVLKGMFLLARGRAAGLEEFGNTSNALAASAAPLIAFPLVGSVLLAVNGDPKVAILAFISRMCVVMALSLVTYEFAHRMQRDETWLRTVTALNWSFWILVPLLLIAGICGAVLVSAGLKEKLAEQIMIALMGAYLLWYHWFTVRNGLRLGIWAAVALVVITNLVVGLLALGPDLIDMAMSGQLRNFFSGS